MRHPFRVVIHDDLDWNAGYEIFVGGYREEMEDDGKFGHGAAEMVRVVVTEAICNELDMVDCLDRNQLEILEGLVENQIRFEEAMV